MLMASDTAAAKPITIDTPIIVSPVKRTVPSSAPQFFTFRPHRRNSACMLCHSRHWCICIVAFVHSTYGFNARDSSSFLARTIKRPFQDVRVHPRIDRRQATSYNFGRLLWGEYGLVEHAGNHGESSSVEFQNGISSGLIDAAVE